MFFLFLFICFCFVCPVCFFLLFLLVEGVLACFWSPFHGCWCGGHLFWMFVFILAGKKGGRKERRKGKKEQAGRHASKQGNKSFPTNVSLQLCNKHSCSTNILNPKELPNQWNLKPKPWTPKQLRPLAKPKAIKKKWGKPNSKKPQGSETLSQAQRNPREVNLSTRFLSPSLSAYPSPSPCTYLLPSKTLLGSKRNPKTVWEEISTQHPVVWMFTFSSHRRLGV